MRLIAIIVSLLVVVGCVSPPGAGSSTAAANAAAAAQKRGDWNAAAELWSQAIKRESGIWKPGFARPGRRMAIFHYELGRSLGVLEKYDEAERNLLEALQMDKKLNGPQGMDLVELARLNHARGNEARAASFFEQILGRMDEVADADLAAYIALLEEATSVFEAQQQNSRADELKAKVEKFSARHPNAKFSDTYGWTPYKATPK